MAFNSSISIDYTVFPRIINIAAPANTLTIQDLYDTLMTLQAQPSGMDEPNIASASGLEELGGGVRVGLTITLLDALVRFEDRVIDTVCKIFGGNLVSYDTENDLFLDVPADFSENVMVTYTSSSSSTQSELEALQYSSYQNAVWVDPTSTNSGTEYPNGTREYPVNTVADAVMIAEDRGFDTLQVLRSIVIQDTDNVDDFTIIGRDRAQVAVTLSPLCSTNNTIFEEVFLSGTLSQNCTVRHSVTGPLTYLNGFLEQVAMTGDVILGGDATAYITNSGSVKTGTPINFDLGGSQSNLVLRDFDGDASISNSSDMSLEHSLYFNTGRLIINPSVTGGFYDVRGHVEVDDNSTGNAVVDASEVMTVENIVNSTYAVEDPDGYNILESSEIIRKMTYNRVVANGNLVTIYEEDEVTEWKTFDLTNGGREQV